MFNISSDPHRTAQRVEKLDRYMDENVLTPAGDFICRHYSECRTSFARKCPGGAFFEGQLHHVGPHYDLATNGRALRIVVVGQEYGHEPSRCARDKRTERVMRSAQKQFLSHRGRRNADRERNPHMTGTTSVLRLLVGHELGDDRKGEYLDLSGSRVHLFEAFALVNFLACSAVAAEGGRKGRSTREMRHNCSAHFRAAIEILEPTVMIAQGGWVSEWVESVFGRGQRLDPSKPLWRVTVGGYPTYLAAFTHPSARGDDRWGEGYTKEMAPYLWNVVEPTVQLFHRELELI